MASVFETHGAPEASREAGSPDPSVECVRPSRNANLGVEIIDVNRTNSSGFVSDRLLLPPSHSPPRRPRRGDEGLGAMYNREAGTWTERG